MTSENARWRKSSYSGGQGGNCVDIADQGNRVLVRDTKQDGAGPVLRFSPATWRRFADQVKRSLAPGRPGLPTPVGGTPVSARGCPLCMPGVGAESQLRPCSGRTVPGLALENGSCRLICGDAVRALLAASAFAQNWAFSSSILPMCSRSWV
jgi:hypothetical protein